MLYVSHVSVVVVAVLSLSVHYQDLNHGKKNICPALQWNGKRHICIWANEYKQELAIGAGCCVSLFNSWRDELKNRILI
jgi:hypothetical protein